MTADERIAQLEAENARLRAVNSALHADNAALREQLAGLLERMHTLEGRLARDVEQLPYLLGGPAHH
jgi:FtsZ-binding cell division protein ZapB